MANLNFPADSAHTSIFVKVGEEERWRRKRKKVIVLVVEVVVMVDKRTQDNIQCSASS